MRDVLACPVKFLAQDPLGDSTGAYILIIITVSGNGEIMNFPFNDLCTFCMNG